MSYSEKRLEGLDPQSNEGNRPESLNGDLIQGLCQSLEIPEEALKALLGHFEVDRKGGGKEKGILDERRKTTRIHLQAPIRWKREGERDWKV